MTIPDENRKIMKNLGRETDYSYTRPARIPPRINVVTNEGVRAVLEDGANFKVSLWADGLKYLMGKPGMCKVTRYKVCRLITILKGAISCLLVMGPSSRSDESK